MIDKNTPIKEELRTAPQEVVNLWHNEYMRRWKIKNKDRVNAYKRDYYKKSNTNKINKVTPTDISNTIINNRVNTNTDKNKIVVNIHNFL